MEIVGETNDDHNFVDQKIVIDTIEKNRDRVRTVIGIILSSTGFLFSANVASLLFNVDKLRNTEPFVRILYLASLTTLLLTVLFCVSAAFLRTTYSITTRVKFINDLLTNYYRELRMVKVASFLLSVALFIFLCAVAKTALL